MRVASALDPAEAHPLDVATGEDQAMDGWNVWSKGAADQAWMVVVEDVTRQEAQAAASRKRAAAERHNVSAEYVALPAGETP